MAHPGHLAAPGNRLMQDVAAVNRKDLSTWSTEKVQQDRDNGDDAQVQGGVPGGGHSQAPIRA